MPTAQDCPSWPRRLPASSSNRTASARWQRVPLNMPLKASVWPHASCAFLLWKQPFHGSKRSDLSEPSRGSNCILKLSNAPRATPGGHFVTGIPSFLVGLWFDPFPFFLMSPAEVHLWVLVREAERERLDSRFPPLPYPAESIGRATLGAHS